MHSYGNNLVDKRVILVAHDLSPAETSQIQLERIKGFVTDRGGRASHTSIIARTLGIPAVPGLDRATRIIKNDEIIVIDGTTGIVIVNPTDQTIIEYSERQAKYEEYKAVFTRSSHLPAVTTDGFRIQIMGNIELPEEVVSVIDNGGEGIGLYRTEFQYLSRSVFPGEDELFDKYQDVVEVMGSNRGVDKAIAAPFAIEALPMVKIEGVFAAADTEALLELVLTRSRTGRVGDGKIFILPTQEVHVVF